MALKTTWSDANLVREKNREVIYSVEPTYWDNSDGTVHLPIYWTVTRKSTASFAYVGMDEATANSCAEAMRREYTRKYLRWTPLVAENGDTVPAVNVSEDIVFENSSSIQPVCVEGAKWQVNVSVNELDSIITTEAVDKYDDIISLFQLAEQREHTWPSGSVAIMKARWRSSVETGVVEVDYNAVIVNFDRTKLKAQIKGANDTWTDADTYQNTTDGRISFYSNTNCTFRLNYNTGGAVSDKWTTKNKAVASVTMNDSAVEYSQLNPWSDSLYNINNDLRYAKAELTVNTSGAARAFDRNSWLMEFYSGANCVLSVKPNQNVTDLGGGRYVLTYSHQDLVSLIDGGATVVANYKQDGVETAQSQMRKVNYVSINSLTCTGATMTSSTRADYAFEMRYTSDLAQASAEALLTKAWYNANVQQVADVATSVQSGVYVRTFKVNLPIGTTNDAIVAMLLDSNGMNCSNKRSGYLCDAPEDYLIITSATHESTALTVKFVTDVPLETYLDHISIYVKPTGSIWMCATNVVMGADNKTVTGTLYTHFSEGMQVYIKIINGETQIQSNTVDAEVVS